MREFYYYFFLALPLLALLLLVCIGPDLTPELVQSSTRQSVTLPVVESALGSMAMLPAAAHREPEFVKDPQ